MPIRKKTLWRSYLVLMHAVLIALGVYVLVGSRPRAAPFLFEQTSGLSRVYTKTDRYVAFFVSDKSGTPVQLDVLPPSSRFEWSFTRENAQAPWKLVVTELSRAGDDVTTGTSMADIFDDNADGVPETRIEGHGATRKFYKMADPVWAVDEEKQRQLQTK